MQAQTLQAEVREKSGKGPARQLRSRGLIPAIYYGPGAETVKLSLSPMALERAITGEYGRNQILELEYGGKKSPAIIKDIEIDPVSRALLHADFYAISTDRKLETNVPFLTRGRSIGVQKGGQVHKVFRSLPVRAFPQDVPASITVDVAPLDLGSEVKVEDLPLPEGVEVTFPPRRRVLFVEYKEVRVEEDEAAPAAAAAAAPKAEAPAKKK